MNYEKTFMTLLVIFLIGAVLFLIMEDDKSDYTPDTDYTDYETDYEDFYIEEESYTEYEEEEPAIDYESLPDLMLKRP